MENLNLETRPTGRSPKGKFYFGERALLLCQDRPKDCQVGNEADFNKLYDDLFSCHYEYKSMFRTCGIDFNVATTSEAHHRFVGNMFGQITVKSLSAISDDWIIFHNMEYESEPKVYIHLDRKIVLIVGTSFLGEIKKGVFSITGYTLPQQSVLPMHCSAFEYGDDTALMFGLSGTGKTTLSADPEYKLIGDDEIAWSEFGLANIETGCYAKTDGLEPETQPTIFEAMEGAKNDGVLIEENKGVPNARASYPVRYVKDEITSRALFKHPKNIFFLSLDATGSMPAISEIKGHTIRKMFETGYTSKMPGTEDGVNEIQKVYSPCFGSPFMPLPVKTYSDMLINLIEHQKSKVYLVNTGMNANGERFPLDETRQAIKKVLDYDVETRKKEWTNPVQPCKLGTVFLHEVI